MQIHIPFLEWKEHSAGDEGSKHGQRAATYHVTSQRIGTVPMKHLVSRDRTRHTSFRDRFLLRALGVVDWFTMEEHLKGAVRPSRPSRENTWKQDTSTMILCTVTQLS